MNAPGLSSELAPSLHSVLSDLTAAVVASWIWAALIAARVGGFASPSLFVASAGAAACTLGPVVVVLRGARPFPEGLRVAVLGALLVSAPVAQLGALLRVHTHHRALGAVTFAITAAGMVTFGALVARRLRFRRDGSAAHRRSLSALHVAALVSFACAISPALVSVVHGSNPAGALFVDAGEGALLATLATFRPRAGLCAAAARFGALVCGVTVVGGLGVLVANLDVSSTLRERAPVALGALGVFTSVGYR